MGHAFGGLGRGLFFFSPLLSAFSCASVITGVLFYVYFIFPPSRSRPGRHPADLPKFTYFARFLRRLSLVIECYWMPRLNFEAAQPDPIHSFRCCPFVCHPSLAISRIHRSLARPCSMHFLSPIALWPALGVSRHQNAYSKGRRPRATARRFPHTFPVQRRFNQHRTTHFPPEATNIPHEHEDR